MKTFAKAAVAVTLLASPCAASAETVTETMVVKLSGVDINSTKGAKTALRRIERAAREFCTDNKPGSRVRHLNAACQTEMVQKAVAGVGNETALAALYRSRQPVVLAAKR